MASLILLMATIPTTAQPVAELADPLASQTASDAAAQKWTLAVFSQPIGPAACAFNAVIQLDSGEQASSCRRFKSGPKSFRFNGDGRFKISVCPGGIGGDPCDDPRCVDSDNTGLVPCTRMAGFEYYRIR